MDINCPEKLASYISEFLSVLKEEVREEKIANEIQDRLEVLRGAYKRNKLYFTHEHIRWLQAARAKGQAVALFIELKEELVFASSIEDCQDLLARLSRMREELQGTGVALRIEKEIRSLHERFPQFQQNSTMIRDLKRTAIINELDRDAPLCPSNHKMTIRSGPSGYFWGCSEYPNHLFTRKLSREQQERIESAS